MSKYNAAENLYAVVVDIVPDWDEWIVNPRARLDLVTQGLERSEHKPDSRFYEYLRQEVNYTGPSNDTAVTLWSKLKNFNAGPIDGFLDGFLETFEERLRSTDDANSRRLLGEVEKLKVGGGRR